MKLLFLDIDGVLNSVKQRQEGNWDDGTRTLDPAALKRLERIMVETGCAVVLTSVWRKRETLSMTHLNFRKKKFPLELIQRFIGSTSVLNEDRCRGREIDLWLKAIGGNPTFVIIDDGSDLAPHGDRFVYINGQVGLQDADVEKVLELFGMSVDTHPREWGVTDSYPQSIKSIETRISFERDVESADP